jgi:alpha-tubulin suppressor-like RCC1 family protein
MSSSKTLRLISLTILTIISGNVFAQTGYQSLYTWGNSKWGQIGSSNTAQQNNPAKIIDSNEFNSITAGEDQTFAIKKNIRFFNDGNVIDLCGHSFKEKIN